MSASADVYSSERQSDRLSGWTCAAVLAGLYAASGIACAVLGAEPARQAFYYEHGPVELSTAIALGMGAALFVLWKSRVGVASWAPALFLLLATARELDADKWFTDKSLLSTGYYFDNPGVPYAERIIFAAVLCALAVAVLRLPWQCRSEIREAIRTRPHVRTLTAGLVLLILSQALDGVGRTYTWLTDARLTPEVGGVIGVAEETTELAMALAFLFAVLQLRFAVPRGPARSAATHAASVDRR